MPQRKMTMSNKNESALKPQISRKHILIVNEQLEILKKAESYVKLCENEFNQLVDAISDVEKRTEREFHDQCTLYFEEIASALIKLVDVE